MQVPAKNILCVILSKWEVWLLAALLISPGLTRWTWVNAETIPNQALSGKACRNCHADGPQRLPIAMQDKACQQCHSAHPPISAGDAEEKKPEAASGQPEVPIQQQMALIPAGEFTMGNDGRTTVDGPGNPDETPRHKVFVEAFYMDLYETTNAMYREFIQATDHPAPLHWENGRYPGGKDNHPVVYVNWHDADAFCRWAGKRLPTEAEWEKAARGTDGRIFPWGNTFSSTRANSPQYWLAQGISGDDLGFKGSTLPVGSFEEGKSPYGLYDMAGNVYEWVQDWYMPYPGNKVWNVHYGRKNKILRGGSWYDCLTYGCGLSAPTYNRSRFAPEIRNMSFGFRCAKSAQKNSGSPAS